MTDILFLGEAYGENEERINRAMVGATGIELLRLCDESGIISLTGEDISFIKRFWSERDPVLIDMVWNLHPELYRTNVFNIHPPGNKIEAFCTTKKSGVRVIPGYPALIKGKHVRQEFQPELDRLAEEIIDVNPNVIVALGNTACWALLGKGAISKIRGTTHSSSLTVDSFKVLPTYHPSYIFQSYEVRPVVVIDLMKAHRESTFPEVRRPRREIWIEPTLEDLYEFKTRHIEGCTRLAVDIETTGQQITEIGFAPNPGVGLVVPFRDSRTKDRCYWRSEADERRAWGFVRDICRAREIRKVFQNGLYDIAFLYRAYGITVFGAEDDTMLLHHSLQPESLKGLGFLGSVYCDEGAWKMMRHKDTTIKKDA